MEMAKLLEINLTHQTVKVEEIKTESKNVDFVIKEDVPCQEVKDESYTLESPVISQFLESIFKSQQKNDVNDRQIKTNPKKREMEFKDRENITNISKKNQLDILSEIKMTEKNIHDPSESKDNREINKFKDDKNINETIPEMSKSEAEVEKTKLKDNIQQLNNQILGNKVLQKQTSILNLWKEFHTNPSKITDEKIKLLSGELGLTKNQLLNIAKSSPKVSNTKINESEKLEDLVEKLEDLVEQEQKFSNESENTDVSNTDETEKSFIKTTSKGEVFKQKLKRIPKTANQLSVLNKEFNQNPRISYERAKELSKQLVLTEKQIKDWFQFQRKVKRQSSQNRIDSRETSKVEFLDKIRQELQENLETNKAVATTSFGKKSTEEKHKILFKCKLCSKSFANSSNLAKHDAFHLTLGFSKDTDEKKAVSMQDIVNNIKQHKCKECGNVFKNKLLLQFHNNEDCLAKVITDRLSVMKQNLTSLEN